MLAAIRGGHLNIIDIILQSMETPIRELGVFREEMLWEAVRLDQEGVMQMLLAHGTDVNALSYANGRDHGCAIKIAASQGYHHLDRILLDYGADLGCESSAPIIAATQGGHKEVVQILIEHGASMEEAFISAVDGGQVNLLEYLLKKGDVVQAKGQSSQTIGMKALERAKITKNPAIIFILIDLGVPINHDNPTPYDDP